MLDILIFMFNVFHDTVLFLLKIILLPESHTTQISQMTKNVPCWVH